MNKMTRSSSYSWPPTLFIAIFVISGLAGIFFPQSFLPGDNEWIGVVAGILIILLGLACGISAQLQFRGAGTPVDPTQSVSVFIENGIYRYSRNPMYLCGCLLFTGLAVAVNSLWILLGLPVFVTAVWNLAIKREERYLSDRFGEVYENYKKRVPRWIGPF